MFRLGKVSEMTQIKGKIPFAIYQFIDKRVVTIILSDGLFSGPLVVADLNDDRSVTIADINLLIDMILT